MHHKRFLAQIDDERVMAAIGRAEKRTSGEIRVFVSHHAVPDALKAARLQFKRLGMRKTQGRNAVLIFVAPKSQAFSIFGDVAIDQRCGAEFWEGLRDQLVPLFKAGQYTEALVHAITQVGDKLARYFPPDGEPKNELPDDILHDREHPRGG